TGGLRQHLDADSCQLLDLTKEFDELLHGITSLSGRSEEGGLLPTPPPVAYRMRFQVAVPSTTVSSISLPVMSGSEASVVPASVTSQRVSSENFAMKPATTASSLPRAGARARTRVKRSSICFSSASVSSAFCESSSTWLARFAICWRNAEVSMDGAS